MSGCVGVFFIALCIRLCICVKIAVILMKPFVTSVQLYMGFKLKSSIL